MKTILMDIKILALSYYDGATEGFIDGMWDSNIYLFKVVAWDQNQDERLYLLGKVERDIFSELLEMLAASQAPAHGAIWVPSWKFLNPEMTTRANEIVGIGERSLLTPSTLALGEDLIGATKVDCTTRYGLASAVALATESSPGDLSEWLAKNK